MFRGIIAFMIGCLLQTFNAYPIKEEFCSEKLNGNYADPDDCHGYIACSNHHTYHMPCPGGLVWNDRINKKRCDWPENAYPSCEGSIVSTSPTPDLSTPSISTTQATPDTTAKIQVSAASTPSTPPTNSSDCQVGQSVRDRCDQLCICSSSQTMVECTRIRKEFTSMTTAERERYIRVVKNVSTDPSFQSQYNALISLHKRIFLSGIHKKEHFLTWHRWYILQYENLLRQVDCKVTIPYWDWTIVSGFPWGTTSKDIWYPGNSGFGKNGVLPTRCVKDGPFRDEIWKLGPSVPDPRCLKRNFTGNPPDSVALAILLKTPVSLFHDFELTLRTTFHDGVHCSIGGTMCSFDSSGAPEFFLHHAMVDKIWTDWQKKSNAHKEIYFKLLNQTLPSANNLHPVDMIDNQALPGGVRVLYAEIDGSMMQETVARLRSASQRILDGIPRHRFSGISKRTIELFHLSDKEAAEAKRLEKKYQVDSDHVKAADRNETMMEKKFGFDYHIVNSNDTYCNGKSNGNYPNSKTCQGYIACSNGYTYHMPCPTNLYWNDAQKRCDWSQYANPGCLGMTAIPTVTQPNNFCTGKMDGDYIDPSNCHGFISCSNGLKYKKYCPPLLVWNDDLKQCDWPSNVKSACGSYTEAPPLV